MKNEDIKAINENIDAIKKHESIDFADWVRERFDPSNDDGWVDFTGRNKYTSEELYTLWKEQ